MARPLNLLFLLSLLFSACSNYEYHDETDEQGFRTEYSTDPETGLMEGAYKQYLPDGTLLMEENYVGGQLQGDRKVYYEGGQLLAEETYVDGNIDGLYVSYYENGKPKQRGNYTDGVMAGKWLKYYDTGAISEEVTFSDNEEDGPFREWYDDGRPKASGAYLGGDKEDGDLYLYADDGQLNKVMRCTVGLCRTVWTPDSTATAPTGPDMSFQEK